MTRALAALFLALAVGCGADATPPPVSSGPLVVETLVAELVPGYTIAERFAGRVTARRTSALGFERSGRVVAVLADEGDAVEEGQVLARLETRELAAQRAELRARVRETGARLELAQLTTERRKELAARASISEQAFDEARFQESALRSQLAAARAALERVEVALDLSELRAPYPGRVLAREVDEGTVVAPGQPLLRLIEEGAYELRVGVPSETAARLERERGYTALIDGAEVPVRLQTRLPAVDPDTRTVTAIFTLPEDAPAFDGALARLVLESERAQAGFWLPLSALTESRRGLWSAFAVVPSGDGDHPVVERRELQLIHPAGERAFVRGTLRDGERIVASGLHRLVPGQRVQTDAARAARPDAGGSS